MNKIKTFIKNNKCKMITLGLAVVGGAIGYSIGINNKGSENKPIFCCEPSGVGYIETLDDAIDHFKEHQKTNKTIALFYEQDSYSVIDLEKR